MKTIRPADLQTLLLREPDLALIDVRTPVEFAEVHVPQAINAPLDQLEPSALIESRHWPIDQPAYLLCRSGARAAKAAEKFAKAGHDIGVVVEGGTLAWIEAGLPVDRGTAKVISLERQVRIAAGSLVVLGLVLAWAVHPYFLALSGFVGVGLVFAGVTDWCGMGLLLAKAPWNSRA
ncbi:MAG TPA: rhodanese-like domain-containing protein [Candidatus Methylacidiphilales bacterium]|jgi:rhodanese-related sulfurtransferase|nr:rhodanese-like domain-containing protein [Candidatus Methylacidiphilales bacterium]